MKKSDFPHDHLVNGRSRQPKPRRKRGNELDRLRQKFKEFEARRGGKVGLLTWEDEGAL